MFEVADYGSSDNIQHSLDNTDLWVITVRGGYGTRRVDTGLGTPPKSGTGYSEENDGHQNQQ